MSRLNSFYFQTIIPKLLDSFTYSNNNEIPRLYKINLNRAFDESCQSQKIIDSIKSELSQISGQKPSVKLSEKSIANFKLKKGMPVSVFVTLRGKRMYSFLDRLVNLVLPRIRDFQGLDLKSFDKFGNYSFSITGLEAFPELESSRIGIKNGINITFCISKSGKITSKNEGIFLLSSLGLPLKNLVQKNFSFLVELNVFLFILYICQIMI